MGKLGWILSAVVAGLVLSTRSTAAETGPTVAPGKGCSPELADRANRLRIRADIELQLPPGAPASDPADPVEMEEVARLLDACLPFMDPRPTVSPADELRSRAALLLARRGALGAPPAQKDQLGQLSDEVDKLRTAAEAVDPKDPAAPKLLDRMTLIARELDRIGLVTEAARLDRAADLLRAKLGLRSPPPAGAPGAPAPGAPAPGGPGPAQAPAAPAPRPATPAVLPADLAEQRDAMMRATMFDPMAADNLADAIAIRSPDFLNDARQLHRRAADLRATHPPPTLERAVELLRLASANPGATSPSTLDAIADAVASRDEITAEALHHRAQEIRALRRIPS